MGYDGKYGKVTTEYGDIPDDEPVIVFRARDVLSPQVLQGYLMLCQDAGSPKRHLALVAAALGRFLAWQDANEPRVRKPDSERSREWMNS